MDNTPLNVKLSSDAQQIEEVVVTALGIKRATKALSYNCLLYTSTINRFRNRVKKEINEVFTQTVLLLSSKGFISLNVE